MKIYVRSDLGMRKGKIGAQVAHAAIGLWLNSMKKEKDIFIMSGKNYSIYKKWVEEKSPIEIIPIKDENELLKIASSTKQYSILITDQGRTEFKGVPTNTCLAVCNDDSLVSNVNLDCFAGQFDEVPAKQVIVANKSVKADKWELAEYVARVSINAIFKNVEFSNETMLLNINNIGLKSWLLGAFAKVVVKSSDEEINELLERLANNNILYNLEKKDSEIICVAVGADTVEKVNSYTSNFKLY
jgi:PTH2 family peptidyl-tRNA hydrolase